MYHEQAMAASASKALLNITCPQCRVRHSCCRGQKCFVEATCPVCLEAKSPFILLPCMHGLCEEHFARLGEPVAVPSSGSRSDPAESQSAEQQFGNAVGAGGFYSQEAQVGGGPGSSAMPYFHPEQQVESNTGSAFYAQHQSSWAQMQGSGGSGFYAQQQSGRNLYGQRQSNEDRQAAHQAQAMLASIYRPQMQNSGLGSTEVGFPQLTPGFAGAGAGFQHEDGGAGFVQQAYGAYGNAAGSRGMGFYVQPSGRNHDSGAFPQRRRLRNGTSGTSDTGPTVTEQADPPVSYSHLPINFSGVASIYGQPNASGDENPETIDDFQHTPSSSATLEYHTYCPVSSPPRS